MGEVYRCSEDNNWGFSTKIRHRFLHFNGSDYLQPISLCSREASKKKEMRFPITHPEGD
jgi:hypothetical protein